MLSHSEFSLLPTMLHVQVIISFSNNFCILRIRYGFPHSSSDIRHSGSTIPNHGADWSATHVLDESWEEWLGGEILVVLLEVLLAGSHQLDSGKLVSASLESRDDRANESTLDAIRLDSNEGLFGRHGVFVESGSFFSCIC